MYVSMTYMPDACNVQACLQISADAGAVRRQDCTHARDSRNEHDPRPARGRIGRRHCSLDDRVSRAVSEYGGDNPAVAASWNIPCVGTSPVRAQATMWFVQVPEHE